jgi:hypothetical protein
LREGGALVLRGAVGVGVGVAWGSWGEFFFFASIVFFPPPPVEEKENEAKKKKLFSPAAP